MTERRTARQGVVGGMLVTLLAEGIALPAGLLTAMVLTRGLGPDWYGRFVVVASTVQITEWLLIAVLARAVVKFVAESADWRPVAATSFRLYLGIGVAIGGALWLLADGVASVLRDAELAGSFRLFAAQVPVFAVGAACRNILAGQGRYRQQALASAVGWVSRLVFIVLFVQLGYGITGAIMGSIAGTLAGSLTALPLVGRAVWGQARFPARQLMQLALPAFLSLLFARLIDQVGLWLLKILVVEDAAVGYYGAAMNVTLVTSVIAAAVTPVLLSTLAAARHRGDLEHGREVSRGTIRFGLALFPFGAVIAGASTGLVLMLFGPDYGPAAPMLALLTIAAFARALFALIDTVFIGLSRAWTAALLAIPLPIAATVAHVFVIPTYGAVGAAAVTMITALVAAAAGSLTAWRLLGVRLPVATALRSVVLASVAFAAAYSWATPDGLVLLKVGVLGLAVGAALFATGELSRAELAALRLTLAARRAGPPGR